MRGRNRLQVRPGWRALLLSCCWGLGAAWLDQAGAETVQPAQLQGVIRTDVQFPGVSADSTVQCFDGAQFAILNPGCFVTSNPAQAGDCTSSDSQFLIQYLFPNPAVPQRLRGFGFLSNDDATVFPAAGALLIPVEGGNVRFPTAGELNRLAVTNIQSPGDTSRVFVDLRDDNLVVQPGGGEALVLVLQFPRGGQLTAPTQGPGIAAEASAPDAGCDFFTVDSGRSGTWFAPTYDPQDPQSVPLDWAFVAFFDAVATPVEALTWSHVKSLYRTP